MMPATQQMTSQLLDASRAGYAALAAERLLEEHPDLGTRFGPRSFNAWRENFAGRLSELSTSVLTNDPELFADQVAWAKVAFVARRAPVGDLEISLRCLGSVLERELPPDAWRDVAACIERALERLANAPEEVPSSLSASTPHGKLAARYVHALLEGDRRRATQIVVEAVDRNEVDARSAYLDVLVPAQHELGRMWHMNEISIAEEHFVTSTTLRVMALLAQRMPVGEPNTKTLVVCSVAGDTHAIGVRLVADFFEADGWRVIDLGADVPREDVVAAALAFSADLVALAATLGSHRRTASETIALVRKDSPSTKVLVGGQAFAGENDVWKQVGADACAGSPDDAIRIGRELVGLTSA